MSVGVFTVYTATAIPLDAMALSVNNDIRRPKNPHDLKGLEVTHTPRIKLPMVAEDGRVVPMEISINHPMEDDHYIKSATIIVLADPIASKAKFLFTPMNGKPEFKFQSRMAAGTSNVYCVIECNKHGRWAGESIIRIVGGGC